MSEAKQTEQTETETEKGPSFLKRLLANFDATKKVSKKETSELIAAYEAAKSKVTLAEKALEKARSGEAAAATGMVLAFGTRPVKLSTGEIVKPSCRGETVFYRAIQSAEIVSA